MSSLASQHLSFREFLISTWNLCTLSHEALVHFVFELYDVDVSDALDGREFDKVAIEAIGGRDAARIMTGVHSIMSGRASALTTYLPAESLTFRSRRPRFGGQSRRLRRLRQDAPAHPVSRLRPAERAPPQRHRTRILESVHSTPRADARLVE